MTETQTLTLTDFLLARLAEDEEQARQSLADLAMNPNLHIPAEWVEGVAARVLADVEAKRRIVVSFAAGEPYPRGTENYGTTRMVLRLLALPYAEHPDYRDEWRP